MCQVHVYCLSSGAAGKHIKVTIGRFALVCIACISLKPRWSGKARPETHRVLFFANFKVLAVIYTGENELHVLNAL